MGAEPGNPGSGPPPLPPVRAHAVLPPPGVMPVRVLPVPPEPRKGKKWVWILSGLGAVLVVGLAVLVVVLILAQRKSARVRLSAGASVTRRAPDLSNPAIALPLLGDPATAEQTFQALGPGKLPKGAAEKLRQAAVKQKGAEALTLADHVRDVDLDVYVATLVDLQVHGDAEVRKGAFEGRLARPLGEVVKDAPVGRGGRRWDAGEPLYALADKTQVAGLLEATTDPVVKRYLLDNLVARAAPELVVRQEVEAYLRDLRGQTAGADELEGLTRKAALAGDTVSLRRLIEAGARPKEYSVAMEGQGGGSVSLLSGAAAKGHAPAVRVLLNCEFEQAAIDDALARAAGRGQVECVKTLLVAGQADANAVADGKTALQHAAANGQVEALRALLEAGADVNAVAPGTELTALHYAKTGEVARLLLNANARLDRGAETPLYRAALRGDVGVMQVLLDFGARWEGAADGTHTPLGAAAGNGHLAAVKLLVERGANVNGVKAGAPTPLELAGRGGHREVERYLRERGAGK
jgi:hypothetical protein